MALIKIRDANNKRIPSGRATITAKDILMMRTQNGENTSIAYEDLLAVLTAALGGGGGGAGFREIYKYQILLNR